MKTWNDISSFPDDNKSYLVYCPENKCVFLVCKNDENEFVHFGACYTRLVYKPTLWRECPTLV